MELFQQLLTSSNKKTPKTACLTYGLRAATDGEVATESLREPLELTHADINLIYVIYLIDYENTFNQFLTFSLIFQYNLFEMMWDCATHNGFLP